MYSVRARSWMLIGALLLSFSSLGAIPAAAAPPVKDDPHAGVTQNWDKSLAGSLRFTVLSTFGGAAVRDNNTGLVWEQSPATATTADWFSATLACINKNVGGTVGWRLPSIPELASLIDPSVAPPGPTLPSGHPFTNVQSADYWSATTLAVRSDLAWFVAFSFGGINDDSKTHNILHAWCVRGPMNADSY